MQIIATPDDIAAGIAHITAIDPRMAAAHALSGPPDLRRSEAGLTALVEIIVSQQLSVKSADAIFARVLAGFPTLDAAALAGASDEAFRACGLSGPKLRTLRAIGEAVVEGRLALDALAAMSPEDAEAHMVTVKGVGPWTAHIYLMFCLGHADAFSPGDLALQEAARLSHGLDRRPTQKELLALAEPWRPWRGVGARMLWRYHHAVKGRAGI
jgi:DNA-3-methyladenine glycosylase II